LLLIYIGCAPEGLSDPINFVSRSALARLYLWARLHQNLPFVGRRLLFYEHPTAEWWTLPVFASDPTRREDRVKPSPYPPEWNSYLLRLVEKGESPGNWTVALLLHYGEVHSRHDRSTSYRSARRTLATKASNLRRRNFSLIALANQSTQPFSCFKESHNY
jgi:hypothetical protein